MIKVNKFLNKIFQKKKFLRPSRYFETKKKQQLLEREKLEELHNILDNLDFHSFLVNEKASICYYSSKSSEFFKDLGSNNSSFEEKCSKVVTNGVSTLKQFNYFNNIEKHSNFVCQLYGNTFIVKLKDIEKWYFISNLKINEKNYLIVLSRIDDGNYIVGRVMNHDSKTLKKEDVVNVFQKKMNLLYLNSNFAITVTPEN
eukprot:EC823367.1.p1 GENE.EC823367.1~~EC823367.1.p1  ORF type:complete len:200 (+),score=45.80 EC823367.1:31-630(+)